MLYVCCGVVLVVGGFVVGVLVVCYWLYICEYFIMLLLVNDGVVLYFVVVFNVCEGVDWVFNFFWVLVLVLIWVDGSEECFFYLVIDCVKLGVIVVN